MQQPRAQQPFQLCDARTRDRRRQAELAASRRHVGKQGRPHEQGDVQQIEPFPFAG